MNKILLSPTCLKSTVQCCGSAECLVNDQSVCHCIIWVRLTPTPPCKYARCETCKHKCTVLLQKNYSGLLFVKKYETPCMTLYTLWWQWHWAWWPRYKRNTTCSFLTPARISVGDGSPSGADIHHHHHQPHHWSHPHVKMSFFQGISSKSTHFLGILTKVFRKL